jgi:hypothetical protein
MAATQVARKARIAAVWGAELDGLDLELFENQQSLLDNRLVCSICTEVLVEAAETKCGHLFCHVRATLVLARSLSLALTGSPRRARVSAPLAHPAAVTRARALSCA